MARQPVPTTEAEQAAAWRAEQEKRKAASQAYRAANREKIVEAKRANREAERERLAAQGITRRRYNKIKCPEGVAVGSAEYCKIWRASLPPEKRAEIRAKNNARTALYHQTAEAEAKRAAWKQVNPEKIKAYKAADKARQRDKEKERRRRAEYVARPEVKQRRQAYSTSPERRAKNNARLAAKRATPVGCLSQRMSVAVRLCLKRSGAGKKPSSRWLDLVGYTAEQLKMHIERQFVRGMGWHNMAEWHVDHIVPLSSFKFTSADHPEFKAAWALTNLRPLWAVPNLRKNARREFLL